MDDVQEMSIGADPATGENKQEKKITFGILLSVVLLFFFSLKENVTVLQNKWICYLLVIII